MILPGVRKETDYELGIRPHIRETGFGEYVAAKFSEGLDWTFLKRAWDELQVLTAEQPEDITGDFFQALTGEPKRLTEDEWRDSEYFREDIPYQENMSEARAGSYSDNYDMRRFRDSLIDKSPVGGRSIIGFGAMLAAQALDPINYIPMLGAAGKARMIAKLGKMGGRVSIGASEAMLGAMATEPYLIHSLAAQGEDVGWTDAVVDIIFSAGIGSLFGGGSALLRKRRLNNTRKRVAKSDRQQMALSLEKALADTDLHDPVDVGKIADTDARARLTGLIADESKYFDIEEPEAWFRLEQVEGTDTYKLNAKPEDIGTLKTAIDELSGGAPGQRVKVEYFGPDEGEFVGHSSTYPDWFRNQGWSAKEGIAALEKAMKGEALTARQADIVEAAGRSIEEMERGAMIRKAEDIEAEPREIADMEAKDYYQLVRTLKEEGYATAEIEQAWKDHAEAHRAESFENIKKELEAQGFRTEEGEINDAIDQAMREIEEQDRAWFSRETLETPFRDEPDFRIEPVDDPPDLREVEAGLKQPDTVESIADDMEIDLRTGDFPELEEIKNLRESGKLLKEEINLLALADENIKKATKYEKAFKVAADCATRT